jgi:hypothetical protein
MINTRRLTVTMTLSNALCGKNEVLNLEICNTHHFPLHYKGSSTSAQAVTLLECIWEVPHSNIDRAADYHKVYFGFCLSSKISKQYLSWVMNAFFHILSTNYSRIVDRGKIDLDILMDTNFQHH